MVETGLLSWSEVADRMSIAPAAIGRVASQGRPIAAGEPANLVLVDPAASWTVDPMALAGGSRNTPFAGMALPASVRATVLYGEPTVLDGSLTEPRPGALAAAVEHSRG